jgi:rhodanese-related sulfurtransferase
MSTTGFKQQLFGEFARMAKALGSSSRWELLDFLAQGERNVEALATASHLSIANASQHLQQLRLAGLVIARKQGQQVYYRLASDEVVELLIAVRRAAESHSANVDRLVDAHLTAKDDLEPIPRVELLRRARKGLVTVLDVRPSEEYAAGHVPGAVNVPLADLEKRLKRLSRNREIVAYCRGPYCVLAYEAVARLRKKGFKARRLQDGFPEWRVAGLPVET